MTCFVRPETREIVYAIELLLQPAGQAEPRIHTEWQQWINRRDEVGRICVGRNLANSYFPTTLTLLRARYTIDRGWVEIGDEEAVCMGHYFQHAGLDAWKPAHPWLTSVPC